SPHSTMSAPHTMNAPTDAAKCASSLAAATRSAAPGVDHAVEIGIRYRHARKMQLSPVVTHAMSRPEEACASVAPTAWRPAMTRAKEVAKPAIDATIPAETDWTMGYRTFSRRTAFGQPR